MVIMDILLSPLMLVSNGSEEKQTNRNIKSKKSSSFKIHFYALLTIYVLWVDEKQFEFELVMIIR